MQKKARRDAKLKKIQNILLCNKHQDAFKAKAEQKILGSMKEILSLSHEMSEVLVLLSLLKSKNLNPKL